MAYISRLSRDGLKAVLTLFIKDNYTTQDLNEQLEILNNDALLKDIVKHYRRTSVYRETGIDLITFLNLPLRDIEILLNT